MNILGKKKKNTSFFPKTMAIQKTQKELPAVSSKAK